MSLILITGIVVNTLSFGFTSLVKNKLEIKVPKILHNSFLTVLSMVFYFGSFLIILFSSEKIFIKIIICLVMQFIVNHVLWGVIWGLIAGLLKRKLTK